MTAPHPSTDEMLRASVRDGDGTTHGRTILARRDAVASARPSAVRTLVGTYRRRVPLGAPLSLAVRAFDRGITRGTADHGIARDDAADFENVLRVWNREHTRAA